MTKCYITQELDDALEADLALQIAYCCLAIIVYEAQRKNHSLSDYTCRVLGCIGLLLSVTQLSHVLLEFGPNDVNEGTGCPEQLTGWVFANALLSCLALLSIWLDSYRE